ncbi:MAG: hypothetical protein LBC80_09140 [Treponema sp.]|jgi:hypothetical protein|nr:hypothetical protein [Treponema sp.]
MKIKKRITQLIFVLVFLVLIISCSRSKPEILFGFVKLVMYQGDQYPQEHLTFFVMVDDEDGIENLDRLYIYHDREQLRWSIQSDEWVVLDDSGRYWIGTRSITIRDDIIPKGVYRAVLINKGGESTERSFTFDGNVLYSFPEITISDDIYNIESEWPVNRLVAFDRNGSYIATTLLTSLSGNISQLRLPSSARSVALWAEDEDNFCSAFTNAVSIR